MNVIQRRDYFMGIMMYKCIHDLAPTYLSDRIDYVRDHNVVNTRNAASDMFYVPRPRVEQFRQSFQYVGPALYNVIPKYVTTSSSLFEFKNKLKNNYFNVPC